MKKRTTILIITLLLSGLFVTETHAQIDRSHIRDVPVNELTERFYIDVPIILPHSGYILNESLNLKNENKAIWLSTLFTGLPFLIGLAIDDPAYSAAFQLGGLIIGPSVGLYYAGNRNRAGGGILIRMAGTGIGYLGGIYTFWGSVSGNDSMSIAGLAGVVIGGAVLIGSAVYDTFGRAPKSVREYNNRQRISLSPWISPKSGTPGLQVSLRF